MTDEEKKWSVSQLPVDLDVKPIDRYAPTFIV